MSETSNGPDGVIRLSGATKKYRNTKTIGPVDLSVRKGTVMGFLGPNGSGKTTCIRMMLGLIRPSSGIVRVNGLDPLSDHRRALRRVGYSPELPNLQTFLTPQDLILLTGRELSLQGNERESEVRRVLDLVGLGNYTKTKIGRLSKGMIQRLSVAQAMVGSPELLIMDEPMIGLDPAGAAHFRKVFREFADRGGTILMSSHIMSEVEALCDRICMIYNGILLFDGPVSDVVRKTLGYYSLVVEAEGLTQACISSIGRIDGVEKVTMANPSTLEIQVRPDVEIRPTVSKTVVEYGAKLYTIKPSESQLERAYIEALQRERGERAAANAA